LAHRAFVHSNEFCGAAPPSNLMDFVRHSGIFSGVHPAPDRIGSAPDGIPGARLLRLPVPRDRSEIREVLLRPANVLSELGKAQDAVLAAGESPVWVRWSSARSAGVSTSGSARNGLGSAAVGADFLTAMIYTTIMGLEEYEPLRRRTEHEIDSNKVLL